MCEMEVYNKVSEMVEYSADQIQVIHDNVAKGTNATELAYFLNVCKGISLNPFNKEVWCYKDSRSNLLIMTGRDGFLSMAQRNPLFDGIRSCEVCENDEFSIDVANNKIIHNVKFGNRGAITGAYAIVFRKGGEPTIELAEFGRYSTGKFVWKSYPEEMIKKVAECHALKKTFGLSGVHSEYDFDTSSGVAVAAAASEDIHEEPLLPPEKVSIVVDYMAVSDVIREAVLGKYKRPDMMPEDRFDDFVRFAEGVASETV